jgi:hypothetical protein
MVSILEKAWRLLKEQCLLGVWGKEAGIGGAQRSFKTMKLLCMAL